MNGAAAVFTGRVVSVEPRLNPADREAARLLNRVFGYGKPDTGVEFEHLKREVAERLPADKRDRLMGAAARAELQAEVQRVLSEGLRVRFAVFQSYAPQGVGSDTKLAISEKQVEVWTAADSCGVPVRLGDLLLIYAVRGESGRLEIGACSGTRLLPHAGDDLVYLEVRRTAGAAAGRISGVIEGESLAVRMPFAGDALTGRTAALSESEPAGAPLVGLTVRLYRIGPSASPLVGEPSERAERTSSDGRFQFLGLPAGAYQLSVLGPDNQELTAPRRIELAANGCHEERIVVERRRH
jgi:hypothetical protein